MMTSCPYCGHQQTITDRLAVMCRRCRKAFDPAMGPVHRAELEAEWAKGRGPTEETPKR